MRVNITNENSSLKDYKKKYRLIFIILTAITFIGFLLGLALFYIFGINKNIDLNGIIVSYFGSSFNDDFIKEFLLYYFFDLKYIIFIFLLGFTIFSPIVSAAIVFYKGMILGFSTIYFSSTLFSNSLELDYIWLYYAVFIIVNGCVMILNILMSCKSILYSLQLKVNMVNFKIFIKSKQTHIYFLNFILLSGFLLILLVFQYILFVIS